MAPSYAAAIFLLSLVERSLARGGGGSRSGKWLPAKTSGIIAGSVIGGVIVFYPSLGCCVLLLNQLPPYPSLFLYSLLLPALLLYPRTPKEKKRAQSRKRKVSGGRDASYCSQGRTEWLRIRKQSPQG